MSALIQKRYPYFENLNSENFWGQYKRVSTLWKCLWSTSADISLAFIVVIVDLWLCMPGSATVSSPIISLIVKIVVLANLIGTHKTGCSGETRHVLQAPRSSWAGKRFTHWFINNVVVVNIILIIIIIMIVIIVLVNSKPLMIHM